MGVALFILGSLVVFVALVMLVINLIRKKPVKKMGVALIAGIVVFGIGVFMVNNDIEETTDNVKKETKEQFEEDTEEIKDNIADKTEEIEEDKKKEAEEEKAKGQVELDTSIEERENAIGKSNKNFLDITENEPRDVRNDVTGKWKMIKLTDPVDTLKYILSYNKLYMEEDTTAPHIIVNFAYETTTVINDFGTYLDVTVHEYVDGEEHDAKELGNGMVLGEYRIHKDNGDIEEIKH